MLEWDEAVKNVILAFAKKKLTGENATEARTREFEIRISKAWTETNNRLITSVPRPTNSTSRKSGSKNCQTTDPDSCPSISVPLDELYSHGELFSKKDDVFIEVRILPCSLRWYTTK